MFLDILLDEVFKGYKMKKGEEMKNLSRINILIGKNNSGKSRFLRRIFAKAEVVHNNLNLDSEVRDLFGKINEIGSEVNRRFRDNRWNIPPTLQDVMAIDFETLRDRPTRINSTVETVRKLQHAYTNNHGHGEYNTIRNLLSPHVEALLSVVGAAEAATKSTKKIYLPMLRGLRPLQLQEGKQNEHILATRYDGLVDNYLKRTQTDYFSDEIKNSRIITGLHLYEETRRLLLGTLSERKRVRDFELFLSRTFFEDKDFSITPREGKDVLYVRIGPDEAHEKPVHDLGDGIQAIIVLTYPLFFYKGEHAVICFEEPETHLHPGLQRLFIETLLKPEFENFQYFLTTHSNHFLDLTADYNEISVYTFSKENEESDEVVIENVENEHENVLQLIGARASSVFLSNCTIWVEGLTDRLYLRQYLKVFQQQASINKKFREDYHYSFVEYGGSNITHWSFLDEDDPENPTIDVERLCAKLFLVTDSDGASLEVDAASGTIKTQKAKRFRRLKKKLEKRYYCLECREIENLLSRDILKKTIIGRAKKGVMPQFKTSFEQEDYSKIPLGTFIKANVTTPGRRYEDGTITEKPAFCREAIKHIYSVADLSPEALKLTRRLYEFIEANNS